MPNAWSAASIEQWPVSKLLPYTRNSRTHSPAQVAQIAASIAEFGFTNPILAGSDGVIVAGHGRLAAAQKLGLPAVPVVVLDHLSPAQRKALVLADNKLALNAGWDEEMLRLEIGELGELGVDLDLLGFGEDELSVLLAEPGTEGETDPDDTPEPQAEAVTKEGDVWVMGRHRIVCGDSTVQTDVDRALNGVRPHLMVTDPPYGVEYDPTRTSGNAKKAGKVLNDDRADWREAWALFPGDVAYVWHADLRAREVVESLEACEFTMRAQIIWAKDRMTLGRGHYHFQHEPCWYAVRKAGTGHWGGGRDKTTVWNIKAREDGGHGHGTQKPVECMKRPIENNSQAGDAVYEPFSGSGTTIIAAEMTGRACHAIELSPQYVDVAVRRWQQFTGQKAMLEATGEAFPG